MTETQKNKNEVMKQVYHGFFFGFFFFVFFFKALQNNSQKDRIDSSVVPSTIILTPGIIFF